MNRTKIDKTYIKIYKQNDYFWQFTIIITETFERQSSNVQVNLITSGIVSRSHTGLCLYVL